LLRRKGILLKATSRWAAGPAIIGASGGTVGERGDFRKEIVLARSAGAESAMMEAETVEGGVCAWRRSAKVKRQVSGRFSRLPNRPTVNHKITIIML
jgi:hypothetical protein